MSDMRRRLFISLLGGATVAWLSRTAMSWSIIDMHRANQVACLCSRPIWFAVRRPSS
jgi:hypothetical protein